MPDLIPNDLPRVSLVGTPRRLARDKAPGGHWEWLWVDLVETAGTIAVFDPDHLCSPGQLGQRCQLGLEVFQPEMSKNERRQASIAPTAPPTVTSTPTIRGQVIGQHRHAWRYSGPVVRRDVAGGPAVTHVIDQPHVTVRLVIATQGGNILAQLRDADHALASGEWVTLRGGRMELLSITPWK